MTRARAISILLAVLILAAFAASVWLASQWILSLLREGGDVGGTTNTVLLALLGGVAYLYRASREKRQELEARLADHKRTLYESYVDILKEFVSANKLGKAVGTPQQIDKLRHFAFRSLLMAPDDVIKAHIRFTNVGRISSSESASVGAVADVLLAIRRDMGMDTKLSGIDLLGVFINDIDSTTVRQAAGQWQLEKVAWDRKLGWK